MSTRCCVVVKDNGKGSTAGEWHAYLHSDGYPDGVGALCKQFINWAKGPRDHECIGTATVGVPPNVLTEAGKMMACFLGWIWAHGYHSAYMTKDASFHGDLEYIWTIELKEGEAKLTGVELCDNEGFDWDDIPLKSVYDPPEVINPN